MLASPDSLPPFVAQDSKRPKQARVFRRVETIAQILGVSAALVLHGLYHVTDRVYVELGLLVLLSMFLVTVSVATRYQWSLARKSFVRAHRISIGLSLAWILGILVVLLFVPLPGWTSEDATRFNVLVGWSQILIVIRGTLGTIIVTRRATAGSTSPALVLVMSFAILVTIGTLLLMLPRARAQSNEAAIGGAPFRVALFTATSASCVTGLAVVHTGDYWSPFGQTVILVLFQVGGLGIMTCGAFFAVVAGRGMQIGESATLRELLESEQLGDVRRLVITILLFTFSAEFLGAVLISGLFADKPLGEQVRFSVFHSVSAFCNAGFSLTENSFVGMGDRWQVWGVVAVLIVVGSMGFAVVYNIAIFAKSHFRSLATQPLFHLPRKRVRLTLTTKLAGGTTAMLLLGGACGYYILETASPAVAESAPTDDGDTAGNTADEKGSPLAEAWFQSVTFRTAGFNTVDHGELQPATKLFAILLMFIGASPGSTGGGVKTVCFAITALSLLSVLRGRPRVEFLGRTIPEDLVNRSLTIISLGVIVVMCTTMLLVLFENEPERFLDHMFEATSAFATVGVSTGITPDLHEPSKMSLVVTMFLGRVGPLTLLLAMAGRARGAEFEYPFERVTLG